ncbi:glycosyl transferase family 2 [Dysgonomonas alginatilytica]|uniref:Glycosyl transferase family 2 n=1 Tax=Dysgonomonas alginatilytica TaxID=1605892 RepID=A0A2V3PM31_9BACT|nr:glycosyltransferase [Dysgonomonas alginatilytica]PXV60959.1 glycosyl transferase family 2 [Dysgonomonas alginatilytica]
MSKPLVSVLIPCYNVENYVIESVSSIMTQTYTNLEIIIINDSSSDGTANKLEELARKDQRIKIYNNDVNLRLIKTLNKGVELCNGKYIARMDADDISFPSRIEKQVDFLERNLDYDIVSTMFYTFKTDNSKRNLYINPVTHEELQAYLLFRSGICHPAVMIRKTLFTELGLKFEEKYLHVEDYALWSKALYCTRLANINEPLLYYRVHESQVSSLNEKKQIGNKKEVFRIHCEKLGLSSTEEDLDIYASVAECVPLHSTMEYLSRCEHFMKILLDKNKSNQFCSSDYLEKIISLHWIRICANSRLGVRVLNKCFTSPLYNKDYYKRRDVLILLIKCTFKMEYKKSFLYKLVFR